MVCKQEEAGALPVLDREGWVFLVALILTAVCGRGGSSLGRVEVLTSKLTICFLKCQITGE